MNSVDVVIPVYRPDEKFFELMRRLLLQKRLPRKVYIMNTCEEYWDEARFAACFEKSPVEWEVEHIRKEEFDHGGTRDRAARKSDADLLLFLTQDALPYDKNLIGILASAIENSPMVGAVYARQLPASDCGVIERFTRSFNYPAESLKKSAADIYRMGIKTYFCSNVCAMYRRKVYRGLGGFIRKTIFNEDMIFAAKLIGQGFSIAYEAGAKVIHSHNYTAAQQLSRNFDLGVSQADHPEVFEGLPSEGEGVKLVKKTARFLLESGNAYLLPELVIMSGIKYLGYFLGKHYRLLPKPLILRLTMNRSYWEE